MSTSKRFVPDSFLRPLVLSLVRDQLASVGGNVSFISDVPAILRALPDRYRRHKHERMAQTVADMAAECVIELGGKEMSSGVTIGGHGDIVNDVGDTSSQVERVTERLSVLESSEKLRKLNSGRREKRSGIADEDVVWNFVIAI